MCKFYIFKIFKFIFVFNQSIFACEQSLQTISMSVQEFKSIQTFLDSQDVKQNGFHVFHLTDVRLLMFYELIQALHKFGEDKVVDVWNKQIDFPVEQSIIDFQV